MIFKSVKGSKVQRLKGVKVKRSRGLKGILRITFHPLVPFLLLLFTSCGGNDSAKDGKLVETMRKTIESNDYTVIYVGAHWCGPCSVVFENKMTHIIDADYENVGCMTIFFDAAGKIKNNEDIMRYSPVILPSVGGIVDKVTANRILKKVFQDYESANYMPIMILSDKERNIINYIDGYYSQFGNSYLENVIF